MMLKCVGDIESVIWKYQVTWYYRHISVGANNWDLFEQQIHSKSQMSGNKSKLLRVIWKFPRWHLSRMYTTIFTSLLNNIFGHILLHLVCHEFTTRLERISHVYVHGFPNFDVQITRIFAAFYSYLKFSLLFYDLDNQLCCNPRYPMTMHWV